MNVKHHLDDATIMSFAAGVLPAPISLVVSAHLGFCETCREKVRNAELIGSTVLEHSEPAEMSPGALNNVLERLDAGTSSEPIVAVNIRRDEDDVFPAQVRKVLGVPVSEIKWRSVARGVQIHQVDLGDEHQGKLFLMRIASGKALPVHSHGGMELTLVLSGSYTDRFGTYGRGDIADLDEDVEHQPVVDKGEDCICIVASEHPAKFKGILPKIFQPFVGI